MRYQSLSHRDVGSVSVEVTTEVLRVNSERETVTGPLEVPKPCLGQRENAEGTSEVTTKKKHWVRGGEW